jgi:hypothetical protein
MRHAKRTVCAYQRIRYLQDGGFVAIGIAPILAFPRCRVKELFSEMLCVIRLMNQMWINFLIKAPKYENPNTH